MSARTLRGVHLAYVNAVKDFAGSYEAGREAALVITHLTGLSRAAQVVAAHDPFKGDEADLARIINARQARQPLAQIIGFAPFRDRLFKVTPDVLCPRADSEPLLEAALAASPRRFLDLGTGPGTLAISLLADMPEARGVASDISDKALAVAKENAQAHGVTDRLELRRGDWLDGMVGEFDLILSNPPYVDAATYDTLAPEITRWEPKIALTPGGDGLEAYRIITSGVPDHLRPGGQLMVEIGFDQGRLVKELFQTAGFEAVTVQQDLGGKDRVVSGIRP